MVSLLAALALQAASKPVWAVADLRDLRFPTSHYGHFAAGIVATELERLGTYEVIGGERVDRAVDKLNIRRPLDTLLALVQIGQELQVTTIVSGEVVEYRVEPGGPARAAVYVIVYDAESGWPVNGALAFGTADFHGGMSKDALVQEAIRRAIVEAVENTRRRTMPMATIVNTTSRLATIDGGSKAGLKTGMKVIMTRGLIELGTASVGKVEESRAEITPERIIIALAPGDRIRAAFDVPAYVYHRKVSIFDYPLQKPAQ